MGEGVHAEIGGDKALDGACGEGGAEEVEVRPGREFFGRDFKDGDDGVHPLQGPFEGVDVDVWYVTDRGAVGHLGRGPLVRRRTGQDDDFVAGRKQSCDNRAAESGGGTTSNGDEDHGAGSVV